jgi:hypothetical protein
MIAIQEPGIVTNIMVELKNFIPMEDFKEV